jgi:hypothetical protein
MQYLYFRNIFGVKLKLFKSFTFVLVILGLPLHKWVVF